MIICDHVCSYMIIFEHIETYLIKCGPFWLPRPVRPRRVSAKALAIELCVDALGLQGCAVAFWYDLDEDQEFFRLPDGIQKALETTRLGQFDAVYLLAYPQQVFGNVPEFVEVLDCNQVSSWPSGRSSNSPWKTLLKRQEEKHAQLSNKNIQ